jgi:hypothetical protein
MRLLLALLIVITTSSVAFAADKLLQFTDLTYLGAFKVPSGDLGGPQFHGLSYGGDAIAYNPANNSLFIVGHTQDQLVAEISIPTLVNTDTLANLNTATVLQNLADITEGNRLNLASDQSAVSTDGVKIGGLIIYGGNLIGSAYGYFDNGPYCVRSHFTSGLTLATTDDFAGMSALGPVPSVVPQAGHVAGQMTVVPPAWRTALGGPVLTGQGGLSILTRTSAGPAMFSFDPDDLSTATAATASALIDYPTGHETIGDFSTSGTLYAMGTQLAGMVFPAGSRSVIVHGRHGVGPACYGSGTTVEAEDGRTATSNPNTCMGTPLEGSNVCCYDPSNTDHGAHSYPYQYFAWAYDADDLARVKAGGRIVDNPSSNLVDGVSASSTDTYKPWHIKPYATWNYTFPIAIASEGAFGGASAYDETNKRLYIVQKFADSNRPIIHAYSVDVETPPAAAPATTPSIAAGRYATKQTVSLSCNESGTIKYSLDGTTPTLTYSSALTVKPGKTLKYFCDDGTNQEAVKTAVYGWPRRWVGN